MRARETGEAGEAGARNVPLNPRKETHRFSRFLAAEKTELNAAPMRCSALFSNVVERRCP